MRYLMMIMGDADFEAGKPPSDELVKAMGAYIGKTASQGVFIDGAGLKPSSSGFKAKARGGKVSFTDGPFAEAREIVGGYAIVEVADHAAARQVVRDFMQVHFDAGMMDLDCEIRPLEAE